ncbi:MAG: HEPN domain-containing protein, partial [Anaerolineae bacterium]|nr:HEPN domain-containing protein [Anaerolineae bacterium]
IEPLVYPLSEYFSPRTYFTYRASRFGKEVFSVNNSELKGREIRALRDLAEVYLAGANRAFHAGDLRIAIDAAYNAAELCVKGLLLMRLDDIPGSHGGLVGKFGELFVQTGEVPRELGRRLNRGLEARAAARYDYAALITEEMAQEVLGLAQELVNCLRQMAGKETTG